MTIITVNDLMTVSPDVVDVYSTLNEAVDMMNSVGCRQLPVMEDGRLVGILSDRDVRIAASRPTLDAEVSPELEAMLGGLVVDHMTSNPLTVTPDTPLQVAAELLSTYKIGGLPVLEGEILVGIITISDVLSYLALNGERLTTMETIR